MTNAAQLTGYISTWRSSVDDTLSLLRALAQGDWAKPTDLPGWDVRAVAAHLAHLEAELAGFPQAEVSVPELEPLTSPTASYTEQGPLARASWTPAQIIDELARATDARFLALQADPPTDGATYPPVTPGGVSWDWQTLLSNRVVDMWMHEQDIRRAVDRPGNLDSAGAAHTVQLFAGSFGYSVGKRVAPPTGTTVLLDVTAPQAPIHVALEINAAGRAVPVTPDPDQPTVSLRMSLESFIILAGGRQTPAQVNVTITGDRDLGNRILVALAVTP